MEKRNKLFAIKMIHTIAWGIFVACILYVCYSGIFDKFNVWTWLCIVAVVLEGLVLLVNKWRCPLTPWAEKYSENHTVGFDIFLPQWLAKRNKTIFSLIFFVGLILVLWRVVEQRVSLCSLKSLKVISSQKVGGFCMPWQKTKIVTNR